MTQVDTATESGVHFLVPQKPVNRKSWWAGKSSFFWMLSAGVGGEDRCLLKGQLNPSPSDQWARGFTRKGRGPHAEAAGSVLTITVKLVIRWS